MKRDRDAFIATLLMVVGYIIVIWLWEGMK
jgi:hypothetical protein